MNRSSEPVGEPSLVMGKLHGLRAWGVSGDDDGSLLLTGSVEPAPWEGEGKTSWAMCNRADAYKRCPRQKDQAPGAACDCGLYAHHPWSAPGPYVPYSLHPLAVHGIVEAWGKVQVYGDGFRAQYARAKALVLLGVEESSPFGQLVSLLAREQRAELLVMSEPEELKAHCRREGLGLSKRAVAQLLRPDPEEKE
ncbi:MAG: hypothetical protein EXQ70_11535 [Solirubrobacterales bacterium]|nr:hypothetical protein [Solirubrobacterales bacterium]